jgi:G3E family GTPase
MHLLTISGFLGSGKTTFLIKLSKAATKKGLRVAILVNEIGEIGIDDQLMRQLDLNVWQLLDGCICCTLAKDLPGTLQKLLVEYSPDVVLLEPSGAADLEKVLSTLVYYKGAPLESQKTVALVDPLRLEKLFKVLSHLITSQIQHADMVLINKIDIATEEELKKTQALLADVQPNGTIFYISAKHTIKHALLAELLP